MESQTLIRGLLALQDMAAGDGCHATREKLGWRVNPEYRNHPRYRIPNS
jgi:hypothetical protein